jgi:hypothetical protein
MSSLYARAGRRGILLPQLLTPGRNCENTKHRCYRYCMRAIYRGLCSGSSFHLVVHWKIAVCFISIARSSKSRYEAKRESREWIASLCDSNAGLCLIVHSPLRDFRTAALPTHWSIDSCGTLLTVVAHCPALQLAGEAQARLQTSGCRSGGMLRSIVSRQTPATDHR